MLKTWLRFYSLLGPLPTNHPFKSSKLEHLSFWFPFFKFKFVDRVIWNFETIKSRWNHPYFLSFIPFVLWLTTQYCILYLTMGWHLDVVYQETKTSASLREEDKSSYSRCLNSESHDSSREGISRKHAAIRGHQIKEERDSSLKEKNSNSEPLHDSENSQNIKIQPSSGLSSTWQSVKMGFQNFKSNIEAKKFIPLRQVQDMEHSRHSSSESLDEIFERIKRPTLDYSNHGSDGDLDDYGIGIRRPGPRI